MDAALRKGHVDVAEYLYDKRQHAFEKMLVSSAWSGLRVVLEWVISKKDDAAAVSVPWMQDIFDIVCNNGDADSVKLLCEFFGQTTVSDILSNSKCFTKSVPVLRFLHSTFDYRVDAKEYVYRGCCCDNEDLLDYLFEIHGLDVMRTEAARDVHVHAYLVRKGLIQADLATAAANVRSVDQLKTLMDLRPDPKEWIEELGPVVMNRLLETSLLQPSLASFFGKERGILADFRIKLVPYGHLDALRAMGGRCTSDTLWNAVCNVDDVEHARMVWEAMDTDQRDKFRLGAPSSFICNGPDVALMEFVALELGAIDRLHDMHFTYRLEKSRLRETCTPPLTHRATVRAFVDKIPCMLLRWLARLLFAEFFA